MRIRIACVALVWLALLALFPAAVRAQAFDDCTSGAQFGAKLSGVVIGRGYISCELPADEPVFLRVRVRLQHWTGDIWSTLDHGTATGRGDGGTPVDLAFREPCDSGRWRITVTTWARASQEDAWSPVDGPFTFRLWVRRCGT